MIKQIYPLPGTFWSDEDLVVIVQCLIMMRRLGSDFFNTALARGFNPEFRDFLFEIYDDGDSDVSVFIFNHEDQETPAWEITPGEMGVGVWTNVNWGKKTS